MNEYTKYQNISIEHTIIIMLEKEFKLKILSPTNCSEKLY